MMTTPMTTRMTMARAKRRPATPPRGTSSSPPSSALRASTQGTASATATVRFSKPRSAKGNRTTASADAPSPSRALPPLPDGKRLLDTLLAYDACNLGRKDAIALFVHLTALPFDAFVFLPPSYRRTAEMLHRTNQIPSGPRSTPEAR